MEEKIAQLQAIAERERLTLRMTFDEEGHGWSARFTSQYHHQPLCTGWSKVTLEEAIDQLSEKAERSIAPYRAKIAAERERCAREGQRQLRRMGVR